MEIMNDQNKNKIINNYGYYTRDPLHVYTNNTGDHIGCIFFYIYNMYIVCLSISM